jgi:hypothetical protein
LDDNHSGIGIPPIDRTWDFPIIADSAKSDKTESRAGVFGKTVESLWGILQIMRHREPPQAVTASTDMIRSARFGDLPSVDRTP